MISKYLSRKGIWPYVYYEMKCRYIRVGTGIPCIVSSVSLHEKTLSAT